MPAFTAIATAVVASFFPALVGTLGGAILGGVIATGLAMLTSRLINGSPGAGGGAAADTQGVRVQLSPSTENKVPVLYGEAYCNSMVIDAYLDDSDGKKNNVMTYVMVISETCNVAGATYTAGDIYWNDMRLVFDGSDASKVVKGVKYVEQKPNQGVPEDFEDTNFDGHVWVNMYAGNSSTKILGSKASAVTAVNEYKAGAETRWTSANKMEGLIFAVVHVKYNAEKGFTGLPTLTFKLRNSVDNPSAVLADYMTSDRYGAGISLADIDSGALAAFETFCNESGPYKPFGWETGDPILTGKRYQINGLIDTNRSCKENIDTICLNSGAWMSYDVSDGQWRVIPKRALPGTTWSGPDQTGTPTDPLPQVIFNDDNITSGIQISSTRLDNLFNIAEYQYYDKFNKDQRGFNKILLNDGLRNYNEPDNALTLNFDLINNNVQAERIANIELKQSRDDLIVSFTTTHYGLQAQAGDVISVYNTLYGWSEPSFPNGKYFRIVSTTERESEEGGIQTEIQALEYNSDVYSNENIQEFYTSSNIGIIPRNSNPNIPAPIVRIGDTNPGSGTPNFKINVTIPTTGGPFDKLEVWYAEGDDWAGIGGDLKFKGQIAGTTLDVIQWDGPNVIRANTNTPGVYTRLKGTNVASGTYVQAFGATSSPLFGNGKTGQYTVNPSQPNTAIQTMTGWVEAAEITGSISGDVLTVTAISGTIGPESLLRDQSTIINDGVSAVGLADDTVIRSQLTGTTGGVGTYRLNKTSTVASTTLHVSISYPSLASYQRLTTVSPYGGQDGLLSQDPTNSLNIREVAILNLPPNGENKKYFIKCRLGIGDEYGEFSELSEVDLEAPVVYWEPDSQSALNIKRELVKMDFGRFTIPRNGLWLMRTAQQLDGGTLAQYNTDYFNLDLGDFTEEQEITSEDLIQDFTYDPNNGFV